jgi:hypothetical protein
MTETITIKGTKLEILRVDTIASCRADQQYNVANSMREHSVVATIWVQRSNGRKLGVFDVFENGSMNKIKWH